LPGRLLSAECFSTRDQCENFRAWGHHSILVFHEKNNSFIAFQLSTSGNLFPPSRRQTRRRFLPRNVLCISPAQLYRLRHQWLSDKAGFARSLPAATAKIVAPSAHIFWPKFCLTANRLTFPCWPMNWLVNSTSRVPALTVAAYVAKTFSSLGSRAQTQPQTPPTLAMRGDW